MKDFTQLISIEEVFPESKFQQFRSFCKRKEIINIIDLTNDHLEEHYSWRGSSRDRKLNETKQRLKSLGKKFEKVVIEDDYELKNSDEPDGFSNMLPGLFKKNMTQVADERIASPIYRNRGYVGVSKDNMKQIMSVELDESQEQGTLESRKKSTSNHITDVFPESKFQQFRTYCKRKEIIDITDLTNDHLEEHFSWKGSSRDRKLNETKQRLKTRGMEFEQVAIVDEYELNNRREQVEPEISNKEVVEKTVIDTFPEFFKPNITQVDDKHLGFQNYRNIGDVHVNKGKGVNPKDKKLIIEMDENQEKESLKSKTNSRPGPIMEAFSDNKFRTFRHYCELNNIQTVYDLTDIHLNQYGDMRGVGVGKVEDVKRQISSYKESFEEDTELIFMDITAKSYEINTIFHEKKFNLFKEFCARNGFKKLQEITADRLDEFAKFKLVGKKRIEEVRTVLTYYTKSGDLQLTLFESGEVYEFIKDLDVQKLLSLYGYNSNSRSKLKIIDIEGKSLAELQVDFEPYLLFDLFNHLKNQKLPTDIVAKLSSTFSDRELTILQRRFGLGETLEVIGNHLGVSRERIRQMENKLVTETLAYLKRERLPMIIRILSHSNYFVTRQELTQLVGAEYEWLISLLRHENTMLKYYEVFDIFFFDNGRNSLIEKFLKDLPGIFNLYDYQKQFEKVFNSIGIDNLSLEMIETIIGTQKYTKYGDIYSNRKLTNSDLLTYLFKHYVNNKTLRIDTDGVTQLQDLARRHLNYELDQSVRSLEARIRNIKNLLLVDRLTFKYFDSLKFDPKLIWDIEYYLNQKLKKRKIMNVEEVFIKFKSKLKKIEVYNKIHLYSLIKYYLEDKFIIGQGNTLNIYKKEN